LIAAKESTTAEYVLVRPVARIGMRLAARVISEFGTI